jgi:two-component system, chemotaxis family, protein-glutamate methylesterase/glutaminase
MALRVLVADDSSLFRRAVADALASIPDVEVAGNAANGKLALQKVRELRPDVLTLDIEMPEMDGLAVLEALRRMGSTTSVIVISAVTLRGGRLTMQALEKGAFDFITKPQSRNAAESKATLVKELGPRLRALAHRRQVHSILQPGSQQTGVQPSPRTALPSPVQSAGPGARLDKPAAPRTSRPELVLIGVSTGGPAALVRLLPPIPKDIGVPIVIVQHMPPVFTQSLAETLSSKCSLQVREAVDGEKAEAGTVLIAPGGRHLKLVTGADRSIRTHVTDDPPENNCRPAVDFLFRSVANQLPGRAMAVILTGMGNDGTMGLRLLRRHGCFTIAQDEATSVVFGMPKAAIEAGLVDVVLPLDAIAGRILSAVKGRGT